MAAWFDMGDFSSKPILNTYWPLWRKLRPTSLRRAAFALFRPLPEFAVKRDESVLGKIASGSAPDPA
jgi:hypothetical protein